MPVPRLLPPRFLPPSSRHAQHPRRFTPAPTRSRRSRCPHGSPRAALRTIRTATRRARPAIRSSTISTRTRPLIRYSTTALPSRLPTYPYSPLACVLPIYTNASAHQAQCEAGFCMAPASVMFMCGMAPNPMMPDPPQWGEGFCRSTIFDWYVLLAPTATHSNALHSL